MYKEVKSIVLQMQKKPLKIYNLVYRSKLIITVFFVFFCYRKRPCIIIIRRNLPLNGVSCIWVQIIYYDMI